jgi:hypothetical protein
MTHRDPLPSNILSLQGIKDTLSTLDWEIQSYVPKSAGDPGYVPGCSVTYFASYVYPLRSNHIQLQLIACSGVVGYWLHDWAPNCIYFMGLEEEGHSIFSDPTVDNILNFTMDNPGSHDRWCPSYDHHLSGEERARRGREW